MSGVSPVRRVARWLVKASGYLALNDRLWERRVSRDPARLEPFEDGLPMPPPYLITLVGGAPSQRWFSQEGAREAARMTALALNAGVALAPGLRVLDFGCGCGRIARWLASQVDTPASGGSPQGGFRGVDINPALVDWCAANLPGRYTRTPLRPPAPVEDGAIDLLYAFSVLTHLTRGSAQAWLKDFARMMAPGGVALVSFHDEDYLPGHMPKGLMRRGYVVSTQHREGSNHMSAWTTRTTFAAMAAAAGLEVRTILSSEGGKRQATAVLAKR